MNNNTGLGKDFKRLARRLYSPQREPAVVASMPFNCRFGREAQGRANLWQAAKESLALFLTEQVLKVPIANFAVRANSWGKPEIRLNGSPGPALSYSWSSGWLWAAVGSYEGSFGLDVAAPEEFLGSYPCHRVFGETEWQTAMALTEGERAEAAALLWTVKEAAVKAEGHGFHFLSPRQVAVKFAGSRKNSFLWSIYLDQNNLDSGDHFVAVTTRLDQIWLTVAWGR